MIKKGDKSSKHVISKLFHFPIYLQVAFRGERPATNGADKWLLARVCPLMDLQGTG